MPHDQNGTNWTHAIADIEPGLRLHYVTAGKGERVIVLLHGFPQTWWEWRHVIPALADAGFRVVAPAHIHARERREGLDADVVLDALYGPIYHRLLHQHAPLTDRFAQDVVDSVIRALAPREA